MLAARDTPRPRARTGQRTGAAAAYDPRTWFSPVFPPSFAA